MTSDDLEKQLQKYKRAVELAKETFDKILHAEMEVASIKETSFKNAFIGMVEIRSKAALTEIDKILGEEK